MCSCVKCKGSHPLRQAMLSLSRSLKTQKLFLTFVVKPYYQLIVHFQALFGLWLGVCSWALKGNNLFSHLQLHIVAKTAGMHHSEWVENADRWIAGFLEKFEEGCHMMVSHLKELMLTSRSKTSIIFSLRSLVFVVVTARLSCVYRRRPSRIVFKKVWRGSSREAW